MRVTLGSMGIILPDESFKVTEPLDRKTIACVELREDWLSDDFLHVNVGIISIKTGKKYFTFMVIICFFLVQSQDIVQTT
jgi:hypothetical protein